MEIKHVTNMRNMHMKAFPWQCSRDMCIVVIYHGCFTADIYGYLDVQLHIYVKMILVAH